MSRSCKYSYGYNNYEFEVRVADHQVASSTQLDFNTLFVFEEKDASLAARVGNSNYETASSRLAASAVENGMFESLRRSQCDRVIESIEEDGEDPNAIGYGVSSGLFASSLQLMPNTAHSDDIDVDEQVSSSSSDNVNVARLSTPAIGICTTCTDDINPVFAQMSVELGRSAPDDHTGTCTVCRDSCKQLNKLDCGDLYCNPCLRTWFEDALTDRSLFPLKCCKQLVREEIISRVMTEDEFAQAQQISEEAQCTNKMYCPNTCCSRFINIDKAEEFLDSELLYSCPSIDCNTRVCVVCKSCAHGGTSCEDNQRRCAVDEGAEALSAMGFQRCNKCKMFVELREGCNHITCHCRHEFCFQCGADWKPSRQCTCELFDQELAIRNAEARVPVNVVGAQRMVQARRNAVAFEQDVMRVENCMHYRSTRCDDYEDIVNWRRRPHCHECNRRLNIFGYVCVSCDRKLCIGCHKHR